MKAFETKNFVESMQIRKMSNRFIDNNVELK